MDLMGQLVNPEKREVPDYRDIPARQEMLEKLDQLVQRVSKELQEKLV